MELRRYLHLLRQRWLLIVITVLIALFGAYLVRPKSVSYSAFATIYVGSRQFDPGEAGLSNDRAVGLQQVARTFAIMIQSDPIARDAIELAGVERSAAGVALSTAAAVTPGTNLILVAYTDRDPAAAQELTNAIADAFVNKVQEFEPGIAREGTVPALPAYVFERASLPTQPNEGGGAPYGVAALFGFLFAAAVAFTIDYLDVTVKSPAELERRGEMVVLGVIPAHRHDVSIAGTESASAPLRTGTF